MAALLRLVNLCQLNLQSFELAVDIKKSVCTMIDPRFNAPCTNIVTSDGSGGALQSVDSSRYHGVFIIRSRIFKCSLHHAEQSFFHAFNAIYGKIGRSASEEIIVKRKCIPCLLYGLDARPTNRTDGNSVDFTVRRTLFKIFRNTSQSFILGCPNYFYFSDINA